MTNAEAWWGVANRTLRPVALLGLASLLSGIVVGGLGGRLAMSVSARAAGTDVFGRVTENGNVVGEFTFAGTLALIVFVGLFGGMIGSVSVVASAPWLEWLGPVRGLGYGLVTLAVFGYDTFASIDFLLLEPKLLNVSMFLGLIIGFGFGVVGFELLLDRKLPRASEDQQVGWLLTVGLGAMPLLMAVLFFTSESFCGCDPAYQIGASLLVMILSTIIYHASTATTLIPAWGARAAMIGGYASLVAAVLFGAIRTIENLQGVL